MKKTMKIFTVLGIVFFGAFSVNAQNCCSKAKTSCNKSENTISQYSAPATASATDAKDSLRVNGACGMCKTRIEKTANGIAGVTNATWDATALTLTYNYSGSVNKMDISNALLAVGHDTNYGKAPDNVYNSLPGCCKYERTLK